MIAESHWWWLMDQKAREDFVRVEGIEQGFEEGVEQGIATGIEQGLATGIEQGFAKGRIEEAQKAYEKTLASASRMKTDGIEPALIAKYTGLSELEIKNL
jgi:flagellar biosynthesis/type III secretory pathway protein FliH